MKVYQRSESVLNTSITLNNTAYIGIFCANLIPKLFTAKVQIVQYPEVVREAPGTPKDMQCTATGDPPPLISWLKDGTPVMIPLVISPITTFKLKMTIDNVYHCNTSLLMVIVYLRGLKS